MELVTVILVFRIVNPWRLILESHNKYCLQLFLTLNYCFKM